MAEEPIGQRIKFLIDTLSLSVRKFAHALDVGETNIRNYLDRGTKPSSDVLEKIIIAFPQVNVVWLLTGEGEAFLLKADETSSPTTSEQKNTYGHNISGGFVQTGINNRQKINTGKISSQELVQELEACQRDNESLRNQLALANALIASKEETIALLRAANRPA